jgi:hypothetical protein
MNSDIELQNDYKKWKDGINYKTNRKIKIGGKIHREVEEKFMISYSHNYSMGHQIMSSVLFEDLININADDYLQETKKINNEIDAENIIIKNYNKSVDSIIEKIQKLEKWNDFIEFEGKYYGITSKVLNNIHIENDCLGKMVYHDDKETIYSIYKCSKCIYENKIVKCSSGGGSHYVSKTGFWWK